MYKYNNDFYVFLSHFITSKTTICRILSAGYLQRRMRKWIISNELLLLYSSCDKKEKRQQLVEGFFVPIKLPVLIYFSMARSHFYEMHSGLYCLRTDYL